MRFSVFFFSFLFLSVTQTQVEWKTIRINGFAQGTTYAITYYAADSGVVKSQVDSILNKIDSSVSLYKPYSFITRFNNSITGIKTDPHFSHVTKKAIAVFKETNGLFDITVQPLVEAWGFGINKNQFLPEGKEIDELKKCVGAKLLRYGDTYLLKKKPCVKIDMNGIAQGYSVDVIAGFLEKQGIKNYIVELGGEIRVKGRKQPSGEKMKIGIESPDDDEFSDHPIQKIIAIENCAITTSGSYRNYRESNGKKISHIINPKTGYPVDNELISVTVYAKDAMTADAYDNALMLMGLKDALKFVEKRKGISAYFIYKNKQGKIADTASSRFYKLMNP